MSKKHDLVVERIDDDGAKKEIGFDGDQALVLKELQERATRQILDLQKRARAPKKTSFMWDELSYFCPECGMLHRLPERRRKDEDAMKSTCPSCHEAKLGEFIPHRVFTFTGDF